MPRSPAKSLASTVAGPPGTEPRSTAQIAAVQPGAWTRKVPSELGRREFLKLPRSRAERTPRGEFTSAQASQITSG